MTWSDNIKVDAIGLAAEVVDLRRELEQQATLLGKGSEREARLLAEKARLENYIAKQLHQLEVENTGQEAQIEQLEAENAALRKGVESAFRSLSACIDERWDEVHVENAYAALKEAQP